jgi:hypothetical protein
LGRREGCEGEREMRGYKRREEARIEGYEGKG